MQSGLTRRTTLRTRSTQSKPGSEFSVCHPSCFFLFKAAIRHYFGATAWLTAWLTAAGCAACGAPAGLGRVLLLQFLTRDVISSQVKAGFDRFVRPLLVHLFDFEVGDRDDALVV